MGGLVAGRGSGWAAGGLEAERGPGGAAGGLVAVRGPGGAGTPAEKTILASVGYRVSNNRE